MFKTKLFSVWAKNHGVFESTWEGTGSHFYETSIGARSGR